jgi:hypothetical protein
MAERLASAPPFFSDPIGWVKAYWEALLAGGVTLVVLHVLFLVIGPILIFLGLKKKKDDDGTTSDTTAKKNDKATTSTIKPGGIAISAILLGALVAVIAPDIVAPVQARGDRFAANVSDRTKPLIEAARGKAIETLGGTVGTKIPEPTPRATQNASTGWSVTVTTKGHFYANQQLAATLDSSIAYLIADPSKAREVPDGTIIARVFTPDADKEYKLLQSQPCREQGGTTVCVGTWLKGPYRGTYELSPGERKIVMMSEQLPTFEMKIE